MNRLSSAEFLDTFIKSYNETLDKNQPEFRNPYYEGKKKWTKLILGDDGVLFNMAESLKSYTLDNNLKYVREWYTVDGLFIGGEDLFRDGLHYPSSVYALVEHEIGENIEEEMWKLVHWRAPLKVLIIYDWADDEKRKKNYEHRANWLPNKLANLVSIVKSVNSFNCENPDTEYLFLVGARVSKNSKIIWKYTTDKDFNNIGSLRKLE